MSIAQANAAPAGVLQGVLDRFGGINIPAKNLPDNDHDFAQLLHGASTISAESLVYKLFTCFLTPVICFSFNGALERHWRERHLDHRSYQTLKFHFHRF